MNTSNCCDKCLTYRDLNAGLTPKIYPLIPACKNISCTCHTSKATHTPEWEKEFKERFGDTDVYPNDLIPKNDVLITRHIIKDFITQLLATEQERVIQVLEGFKEPCDYCHDEYFEKCHISVKNQTIKDAIEALRK